MSDPKPLLDAAGNLLKSVETYFPEGTGILLVRGKDDTLEIRIVQVAEDGTVAAGVAPAPAEYFVPSGKPHPLAENFKIRINGYMTTTEKFPTRYAAERWLSVRAWRCSEMQVTRVARIAGQRVETDIWPVNFGGAR